MAWPVREDLWGDGLLAAREAFAEVARSIAEFEPVTMVAAPDAVADVSLYCGGGVGCMPLAHDDSWMRDIGPTFLADGAGNVAGVDWTFNGWGERYTPYERDAGVAEALLTRIKVPRYPADIVLEGGAIHTDGAGTLLTTEAVMLDPRRTGFADKAAAESALHECLGVEKVVWLGEGLQDDDTGGHVDNLACFARPGVVLALSSRDPRDANYSVLQDNLRRLRGATDAAGRPLKVIEVMQPAARRGESGRRLPLSYINFYLANGAVVMPAFEDAMDEPAYQAIARAFPKRKVVSVPALDIVQGGGGIHCITQQQPTGVVER
jgi:agmatine deiminase